MTDRDQADRPSRASRVRRPHLLAAVALLSLQACSRHDAETLAANAPRSGMRAISYTFPPTQTERVQLPRLLERMARGPDGAGRDLDLEVSRFGQGRYLVISAEPTDSFSHALYIVLYVLEPDQEGEGMSGPFDTHLVDRPGRFEPLSIVDLDADSLPDLPFCGWTTEDQGEGFVMAVGFRDGQWYVVDDTVGQMPTCPRRWEP